MYNLNYEKNLFYGVSDEELTLILNNCFSNLFVTDGEGRIIFLNDDSSKSLGISYDELLTLTVYDLKKRGIISRSITSEVLEQKQRVIGTYMACVTNKELICVSTPVFNDDGSIRMVVTYSREKDLLGAFVKELEKERQISRNYKQMLNYIDNINNDREIVINSDVMRAIFFQIDNISKTDSTVMLYGETGTGKEVIANYVHQKSARSSEPFVPVNCAAIPEELIESEFFGYERGAFTGANREGKIGIFELANNGTLFLDELGELSLPLQSKLLRVLETGQFRRVGGSKTINTDVRLICATNRNLKKEVLDKRFREDLYYRLNVIPINIPPLRDRHEDLEGLISLFLKRYNKKYNYERQISYEIIECMKRYSWPGNIRELKNLIERYVITDDLKVLQLNETNISISNENENKTSSKEHIITFYDGPLKDVLNSVEKLYINKVLKECNFKVAEATDKLGIHRSVLYKKIKKYCE